MTTNTGKSMNETFVYDDIEVKKTGRTASKPVPGGKFVTLCEITPNDPDVGTWKKWVNPSSLFIIGAGTQ